MQEEKSRKRVFFVPMMFIGMGVGFLLSNWLENAFVACMFVGMGLGALLDSLFVVGEGTLKSREVRRSFSLATAFLGVIFILIGASLLFKPSLLEVLGNYIVAICFIAFGVHLLVKEMIKE